MLFTRICPFVLLLCHQFAPILAIRVKCLHWSKPNHTAAECKAAIQLIAEGTLSFAGSFSKPLSFFLPPAARQQINHLKPVWRSGSCTVRVERYWHEKKTPRCPPELPASALYFKVLPAVKAAAKQIAKECFSNSTVNNAGYSVIHVNLYGRDVKYTVIVGEGMRGLPEKSGPFTLAGNGEGGGWPPTHNLYTAGQGDGEAGTSPLRSPPPLAS